MSFGTPRRGKHRFFRRLPGRAAPIEVSFGTMNRVSPRCSKTPIGPKLAASTARGVAPASASTQHKAKEPRATTNNGPLTTDGRTPGTRHPTPLISPKSEASIPQKTPRRTAGVSRSFRFSVVRGRPRPSTPTAPASGAPGSCCSAASCSGRSTRRPPSARCYRRCVPLESGPAR
jgi:hypothetical protein